MKSYYSAAMRGRSKGDWHNSTHYQSLEIRSKEYSNAITHATKDSLIVEIIY